MAKEYCSAFSERAARIRLRSPSLQSILSLYGDSTIVLGKTSGSCRINAPGIGGQRSAVPFTGSRVRLVGPSQEVDASGKRTRISRVLLSAVRVGRCKRDKGVRAARPGRGKSDKGGCAACTERSGHGG